MPAAADTASVHIAPIARRDFAQWKRMREQVYGDLDSQFHDDEIEWLFASPDAAAFIAWQGDEAIGLLELTLRNIVDGCIGGPVGYIEGLFVAAGHRGRGIGRQLIEFAAAWFRARGCRAMATDAEIDNTAAQAFYVRSGFRARWRTLGFTKSLAAGDAVNAARCTGIHHVNIRVPADEIPALAAFYADVVGLTIGARPPFRSPGVWLYAGEAAVVHLSQCRDGETLPPVAQRRSGFNHVALDCTGFAAMAARLESLGIAFRVTEVPLTRQRQIFFQDPAGVGIEMIFPLDESAE